MKLLKQPLKQLNCTNFANVETTAHVAYAHLEHIQTLLYSNPSGEQLHGLEREAAQISRDKDEACNSFLA